MSTALFDSSGKPLQLGRRIGKGGEGEVFVLASQPDIAVKLYTVTDLASRAAKIAAMVSANLAQTSPLIAFPMDIVKDARGSFVGFTMRLVPAHQPLHELYAPGARKAAFPGADYRFLVRTATNIARAIAQANQAGCVIGDINHSGILISNQATVALIDADSFQITSGSKQYLCRVGVPEYTPPELQGRSLDVLRTAKHDAFGLAVATFQLLFMGRHPFAGRYAQGDMPFERAIKEYRFAYTRLRDVGMKPPPGVPTLDDFPTPIASALEQAFGPNGPQSRPDASQWVALLAELERGLRVCSANPLHHFPETGRGCPWCRMELALRTQLFVPKASGTAPPSGSIPMVQDWRPIWATIEAVRPPRSAPASPQLPQLNLRPSAEVRAVLKQAWKQRSVGFALVVVAVILIGAVPDAALLWIGLLIFGLVKTFGSPSEEPKKAFVRRAESIEDRWAAALAQWRSRAGDASFARMKSILDDVRKQIESLADEEKARIRGHEDKRRSDELRRYLDQHLIRQASISGIGSTRQALLASYGIETAADVDANALLRVPGFGPINSRPLMEWRSRLVQSFRYSSTPTAADAAAIATIRTDIANKARGLIGKLAAGPAELQRIVQEAEKAAQTPTPELEQLHRERGQAHADLRALGLPLPTPRSAPMPAGGSGGIWTTPIPPAPPRSAAPPPPRPTTLPPAPKPRPQPSQTTCPQCGSAMWLRTAKRGSRRGQKFYGCSRFPRCRGTRPYP